LRVTICDSFHHVVSMLTRLYSGNL
jgi:hypothetical protein